MLYRCALSDHIVLFKMFSQWFFVNNKFVVGSTALKLDDVTDDAHVMVIHRMRLWQHEGLLSSNVY